MDIEANQRQQSIDIEKARLAQTQGIPPQRESKLLQDRVLDTDFAFKFGYADLRSDVAKWRVNQDVSDAFTAARKAHSDFDALLPIMRVLAESLRPDWTRLTMADYIESLYAVAQMPSLESVRRIVLAANPVAPKP